MTSPKWTSIVNRQASTTQHGHKNVTQKHVNKRHNICRICQTSRAQNAPNAPHLAGAAGAGHGRRSTGTRRLGCGRLGRGRGGRRRSGLSDKEWKEAKVAVFAFLFGNCSEIFSGFFGTKCVLLQVRWIQSPCCLLYNFSLVSKGMEWKPTKENGSFS